MADRIAYRPANGSEVMDFISRSCARCERDRDYRENDGDSCPIVAATMAYDEDDPCYPAEWRHDGLSGPRCTAFEPAPGEGSPLDPAAAVRELL